MAVPSTAAAPSVVVLSTRWTSGPAPRRAAPFASTRSASVGAPASMRNGMAPALTSPNAK